MLLELLAVIRGEHDEGPVIETLFLEEAEELPQVAIQVADAGFVQPPEARDVSVGNDASFTVGFEQELRRAAPLVVTEGVLLDRSQIVTEPGGGGNRLRPC